MEPFPASTCRHQPEGGPAFFYVDHYFQDKALAKDIPAKSGDRVYFVDTGSEPTVEYMDSLADGAKAALDGGLPCCIQVAACLG